VQLSIGPTTHLISYVGVRRLQLKCDGTQWHAGGEVKGKLANEVDSTLYTTSEHVASSITTADAHPSSASSRLNWRPRQIKWTRRKTKSGFCACVITFQLASTVVHDGSCEASVVSLFHISFQHSLLYNGYRIFLGGIAAGAWRWPRTPSSAEVKERVQLYLFSPSGPSWPVLGWALPLPCIFCPSSEFIRHVVVPATPKITEVPITKKIKNHLKVLGARLVTWCKLYT